jgi:hypothetical protein
MAGGPENPPAYLSIGREKKMLLDDLLMDSRAKKITLTPFTYSAVFPIAVFLPGVAIPININIQSDSDFIWRYTTLSAYTAPNVPAVAPDYYLSFFDTASGSNYQDQPIHVACCTGTGILPYILPEPVCFKANAIVTVTMLNVAGGVAALATVVLGGFKVKSLTPYTR